MDDKKGEERKKIVVEEVPETPAPTAAPPEGEVKVEPEQTPTEPSELEPSEEKPIEVLPKEETEITETEPAKAEEQSEEPPIPQKKGNRINPVWIIVPAIFVILAFAGGIYVYQTGVKVSEPEEMVSEELVVPTSTPEPTPTATPDITAFTIDIENGSGIAGEAGKVKTLLEDAGFKVGTTGNADRYDYTKTEISAKEEVSQDFLIELANALKETYEVAAPETLSASSSSDIIVIVGQTKAE